uniref:Mariner Mos1 transposase n=1 Tax=Caenorhabditis japonica TaxID=281687 RepID=A0A8R1EBI3_CAEJA
MICLWWLVNGVEYWDILEDDSTMKASNYIAQLRQLRLHVELSRGKKSQDLLSTRQRPSHVASYKAEKSGYGWTVLVHPLYSPDFKPSDYHLFSNVQRHLQGKK